MGEVLEVGCRFSQKIDGSGNALAWLLWVWQQNPSEARLYGGLLVIVVPVAVFSLLSTPNPRPLSR